MKNKKFDPDSAFKSMVTPMASDEGEKNESKDRGEIIFKTGMITKDKKKEEEKLIQTGFYITDKQHKALKMKALVDESDMSSILRELLEKELREYILK